MRWQEERTRLHERRKMERRGAANAKALLGLEWRSGRRSDDTTDKSVDTIEEGDDTTDSSDDTTDESDDSTDSSDDTVEESRGRVQVQGAGLYVSVSSQHSTMVMISQTNRTIAGTLRVVN
jgi:uncharacterized protein YlxW (UPF0749 family)